MAVLEPLRPFAAGEQLHQRIALALGLNQRACHDPAGAHHDAVAGGDERARRRVDRSRARLQPSHEALVDAAKLLAFRLLEVKGAGAKSHSAIESLLTGRCSMRESRATRRVSNRRGIRLVTAKLTAAWPVTASSIERSVLSLRAGDELGCDCCGLHRHDLDREPRPAASAALAGEASVAPGPPWLARLIAAAIPAWEFDESRFFRSDDAPEDVAARRRVGFERLAEELRRNRPETLRLTAEAEEGISDLQFTAAYRAPFPYRRFVRAHLGAGAFAAASAGVTMTDLDGNVSYDLTGSYGVNLFGHDFYKDCIETGRSACARWGPCSAPIIPSSPRT